MKHAPEPWTGDQYGNYIRCFKRTFVCQFGNSITNYKAHKENSKRIVECVNAFQGIEKPDQWMRSNSIQMRNLKRERDQMIQVLKDLHTLFDRGESISPQSIMAKAIEHAINQ